MKVYPSSTFTDAIRKSIEAKEVSSSAEEALALSGEAAEAWRNLPDKEQEIARARLEVLRACDAQLARGARGRKGKLPRMKAFYQELGVALKTEGNEELLRRLGFPVDKVAAIRTHVKSASLATDYRWRADYERAEASFGLGLLGLARTQREAPGYGAKCLTPDMVGYARTLITKGHVKLMPIMKLRKDGRKLNLNAAHLFRRLEAQFGAEAMPSYAHFTRWINGYLVKEGESLAAIVLPSWWRSHYGPSVGCAAEVATYAGQRWELDGTKADVMLKDGRHEVLVGIDVFSRDMVVEVERNASAVTVAKLLYDGIMRWGKPETVVTDRGSIFLAAHIQGACDALDIKIEDCAAYSPDRKGHVESVNGTLCKMLFESMTWYIGHDPKQRKRIDEYNKFSQVFYHVKGEKISCEATADEFRKVLNDWLEKVYRAGEHKFADLHLGRSRYVLDRLSTSPRRAPKVSNPQALEMLLSPSFVREFDSGVSWANGTYLPVDVPSWERAQEYARRKVLFRPLLSDVGKGAIWEITPEERVGKLICHVTCDEREGLLEEFHHAKKKIEKTHRKRRRAVEALTGPQTYEAELAQMPMPKVAVANFGAVEFEGDQYKELVDFATGAVTAKTGKELVSAEMRARIFEDLAQNEAVLQEIEEREKEANEEAAPPVEASAGASGQPDDQRAEDPWERLRGLPDAEQYEELLEIEARGALVPREFRGRMKVFEQTDLYARLKDYYEERRAEFAARLGDE